MKTNKVFLLMIAILVVATGCQPAPALSVSDRPAADLWHPGTPAIDVDFFESSSVWCVNGSYLFGDFYCQEGEVHLVNKGTGNIATIADGDYTDFTVQAKMRSMDGSGSYGLVFRGNETTANYYLFRVRPTGQFQLVLWSPAREKVLIPWTESAAIHKDQETNELEITATGLEIRLFLNKEEVASISDSTLTRGSIGPVATEQGHAIVESLRVWKIKTGDGEILINLV